MFLLIALLNWFSWFAKCKSFLWLLWSFGFSKQSSTHDLLDILSEGWSSIRDRRYSFTSLLHFSTTAFISTSQTLSHNRSSQHNSFHQSLMQIYHFLLWFKQFLIQELQLCSTTMFFDYWLKLVNLYGD